MGNIMDKTHIIIAMDAKKQKKVVAAFEHLSLSSQEKNFQETGLEGIFLNLEQDIVKNSPLPSCGSAVGAECFFTFTQPCAGVLASTGRRVGKWKGRGGGRKGTSSLEKRSETSKPTQMSDRERHGS